MDEVREKYLQGKLTEAEKDAFEANLSPEEQEELAFELGVRERLEEELRKELRMKVAGFEKKVRPARRINPAYIGVAASLFLVASLAFYLTRQQESLFDEYYQPYPNYELTSVRGEQNLSDRQRAYQAYDDGKYEAAAASFGKLDSLSAPDYFFRGICLIQMNNDALAVADFQRVAAMNDQDYVEAANWYTALIYVKLNDKDRAKALLEILASGNSEMASSSRKLLDRL
ncbi:hypothetical protein RT717_05380 [Imperialibacter roseus]|uniref:Tetratricopeptide repeat protein n=1 Tax=Imperialibacter roseus TaxID=1324217 RepID=A0ABZ0IUH8_9BACT|nr:hypothetical protein [Imperialibacter roseus]WOK08063.1 hypothetical protein RT717_05380 [Imperialibacter roseus]